MEIKAGKKYIVRSDRAGVFYGEVVKLEIGVVAEMKNVRKIAYWSGACEVEGLATYGVTRPEKTNITAMIREPMSIAFPVQCIPMTDEAVKNLDGVSEWKIE